MTEPPDPVASDDGDVPVPPRVGRIRTLSIAARNRAETLRAGIEARRPSNRAIDATIGAVQHHGERGGDLLAGAIAYRVFLWILPASLVVVAGLGFLSAADEKAPEDVAKSIGAFGFAAQSVSDAAADSAHARWWALLIGVPLLYLASVGVAKVFWAAFSLAWGMPVRKLTHKPIGAAGVMIAFVVACVALSLEGWLRRQVPGLNPVVMVSMVAVFAAFWLVVSLMLPHRAPHWWQLVPGAVLFSVGAQAVHVVTVVYVSRKVESSTYGVLGAAAAMLLSLYLLARVAIAGAVLNAEIYERDSLPDLALPDLPENVRARIGPSGPVAPTADPDPPAESG